MDGEKISRVKTRRMVEYVAVGSFRQSSDELLQTARFAHTTNPFCLSSIAVACVTRRFFEIARQRHGKLGHSNTKLMPKPGDHQCLR